MNGTSKNTFLAIVCFIAGIGISLWGISNVLDAMASSKWPTTEGIVQASGIEKSSSGSGTSRSTGYHAKIQYTYQVDNQPFQASRISYKDDVSKTQSHAQRIAQLYRIGQSVKVHYDHDQPGNAVLEPGVSLASFIYLGLGLAILGLGVYTVMLGRSK